MLFRLVVYCYILKILMSVWIIVEGVNIFARTMMEVIHAHAILDMYLVQTIMIVKVLHMLVMFKLDKCNKCD